MAIRACNRNEREALSTRAEPLLIELGVGAILAQFEKGAIDAFAQRTALSEHDAVIFFAEDAPCGLNPAFAVVSCEVKEDRSIENNSVSGAAEQRLIRRVYRFEFLDACVLLPKE